MTGTAVVRTVAVKEPRPHTSSADKVSCCIAALVYVDRGFLGPKKFAREVAARDRGPTCSVLSAAYRTTRL